MSRWLPDNLELVLAPDRLVATRTRHPLKLFGAHRPAVVRSVLPVAVGAADAPVWRPALATLDLAFKSSDAATLRYCRTTLVLSNHFVRYALVPGRDLGGDDNENRAVAHHYLHELCGGAVDGWELRIAAEPQDEMSLVCATEPGLLSALRASCAQAGVRLVSIQPKLMAICNRHRRHLTDRDAWLAVVEPGSLCLARMHQGQLVRLHNLRIGSDWPTELIGALHREDYLGDAEPGPRTVLLVASAPNEPFPPDLPWDIRLLEPALAQQPSRAADAGLALAPGA